jgi:anhydro-N-acetylmuramic acid kinase
MPSRWIVGLSSGACAEGVDAVLLELEGVGLDVRLRQLRGLHQAFTPELRDLVRRVGSPTPIDPRRLAHVHRLLGETYAAAGRAVADQGGASLGRVQAIGCAGFTIGHDGDTRFPGLLPLGMPAVIAERCGVTVVSDFHARDLAAGGQGTSLAALADRLLFADPTQNRLLLHLGGFARVVYLPAAGRPGETVGFEACPCNHLLDALIRQLTGSKETHDAGGKRAVQGRCLADLLNAWLAHPALHRRPPRSLPRAAFGDEFAAAAVAQIRQMDGSLHDLLCTATHFVARGIVQAVRRFLPAGGKFDRVLLSGGGVRNGFLWQLLSQQLAGCPMARTDEVGIPAESRKAAAYGVLAALTLDGVPGSVPGATGAAGSRLLGSLTPGSSSNWARCLHWMAQQSPEMTRVA